MITEFTDDVHMKLYFVDDQGKKLPTEDSCQHYYQYGGSWSVEIDGDWNGGVGLLNENNIFHLTKISSNQWVIPKNDPMVKEISTRSGWITAVLIDRNFQRVFDSSIAILCINPAGLTAVQLQEMLDEIRLLALSVSSVVCQKTLISMGDKNGQEIGKEIMKNKDVQNAVDDLQKSLKGIFH